MWICVFYQYSPGYVIVSTFLGISCFKFNSILVLILISRVTTKLSIYEFSYTLRKESSSIKIAFVASVSLGFRGKIPFLGLSLLPNLMETLATQANIKMPVYINHKIQQAARTQGKINYKVVSFKRHRMQLLLWPVWENHDRGRKYRPNAVRSVHTTDAKILSYKPTRTI